MVVGEFTQETDLVVIGGGPAGYSAAFRAAELGVQTVIVDSRPNNALGGVCLHEGCIPSKTLLHIAEMIRLGEASTQFGVAFGKPKIDAKAVWAWKNKTVEKLTAGLAMLCKKHGVERIEGQAHFEDSRNIALINGPVPRIRFRRALIAVGSRPRAHPKLPFDGKHILTHGEALNLGEVPKRLLIVGNDYIAAELATIFSALGSAVTIAHDGPRLLPDVDADLARIVAKRLESQVNALHHDATIEKCEAKGGEVRVKFSGGTSPATFDCVIVSIGHLSNTLNLGVEKTKAQVDADGFVAVDSQMRTADPRLFAAGDVTGPPLLADRGIHQGLIAAEVIAGRDSVFDARAIPMAIFTDPQIAWCGLSEDDATRQAVAHAVVKVPWGASGRAVGMGRSEGLTKLIFDPESRLVLGAGLVGPHASEMIAEAALAIEMGATLTDLAKTIHPHPTMSELLSAAARQGESA